MKRSWILLVAAAMLLAACDFGGDDNDKPPAPPAALIAKGGDASVTLEWADTGAESYNVYFANEPDITPSNFATLEGGESLVDVRSPLTLDGLENHTGYWFVVTAIDRGRESAASPKAAILPEPPFEPLGGLNDTGVSQCLDGGTLVACPVDASPGQDAEHGRDFLAANEALEKRGEGAQGFDFTKIAADGSALPMEAEEWFCVRDNVTGLMWEVKLADSESFRFAYHLFGYAENMLCGDTTGCTPTGFIEELNERGLCGANDWRLPSRSELLSIYDYGQPMPAPDDTLFNAPGVSEVEGGMLSSFWTGDPLLQGGSGLVTHWTVTAGGFSTPVGGNLQNHVRAVRNAHSAE